MSNSFNDINSEIKSVQTNVNQALKAIEPITLKLDKLLEEKKQLKQQTEDIQRKITDLNTENSELRQKFFAQNQKFESQQRTYENQIESLRREVDLLLSDKEQLTKQLKVKDDKIATLESQKNELVQSLRSKVNE